MDIQDFIKQLKQVQELMNKEKYKEAISLIEKLKEIETESDFNYNLTHKLYQLDSNAHSLFNQQNILKIIYELSNRYKSITFQELNQIHFNFFFQIKPYQDVQYLHLLPVRFYNYHSFP